MMKLEYGIPQDKGSHNPSDATHGKASDNAGQIPLNLLLATLMVWAAALLS